MKIKEGEVFSIKTKVGFGFMQYITQGKFDIEEVRVLEPIKATNEITQDEVDLQERFTVGFVVKAALRRKLIERTGIFRIPPSYVIPTKAREMKNVRGEFLGWHIIDKETLKRELKFELSAEELKLSPHGIPNDTALKEDLENDFRLENWK